MDALFASLTSWARPLGLLAFALPLVLALRARLRRRPLARASGTLRLWSELAGEVEARSRARRKIPAHLLLKILALAAGALALAGPRPAGQPERALWRVLVDASPSMFLPRPVHPDAGQPPTRLAHALELARPFLEQRRAAGDTILWTRHAPAGEESVVSDSIPKSWLSAPRASWPEPVWSAADRPGTLWITDKRRQPERAGLAVSGGAAVPGPIGVQGTTRFDWDGQRILALAGQAPARELFVSGGTALALDERGGEGEIRLRSFLELWAAERGISLGSERNARTVLEVSLPPSTALSTARSAGQSLELAFGRDAWWARALVDPRALAPGVGVWLEARDSGGRVPLVRAARGRVELAFERLLELRGDAAFAVSWAKLLDGESLSAPGLVAVEERAACGPAHFAAPQAPSSSPAGTSNSSLDAWLAGLAALLYTLGLGLGRRATAV